MLNCVELMLMSDVIYMLYGAIQHKVRFIQHTYIHCTVYCVLYVCIVALRIATATTCTNKASM